MIGYGVVQLVDAKELLTRDEDPPDVYIGELRGAQTHLRDGSSQKGHEQRATVQVDLRGALFQPIRYLEAPLR